MPNDNTSRKVAKAKQVLSNADQFQQSVTGRSATPATHISPTPEPSAATQAASQPLPGQTAGVNSLAGNIAANSDLLSFNK